LTTAFGAPSSATTRSIAAATAAVGDVDPDRERAVDIRVRSVERCDLPSLSDETTAQHPCDARLASAVACDRHSRSCLDATAAGGSVAPVGPLSVIVGSSSGRYRHAMTDENEDDEDEFEPLQVFPDPVHIKGPRPGRRRTFGRSPVL
jgi:hypothetical protein